MALQGSLQKNLQVVNEVVVRDVSSRVLKEHSSQPKRSWDLMVQSVWKQTNAVQLCPTVQSQRLFCQVGAAGAQLSPSMFLFHSCYSATFPSPNTQHR